MPVPAIEKLAFKEVSFTYDNTGIEALKDISFEIKRGEQFAIVGKTGTGKSTIAELILRSFDATKGKVEVNDVLLQDLDVHQLRNITGYVPQDVFLFSATVGENIRFGLEHASESEIIQAAKDAEIHKDIEYLKYGYETIVGERGVTLSGGQKQRISIARALVKQPELLILDDCLSAVDANTEHKILNNFKRAFENRTVIFITHRIFALMDFDKILVLDEGTIKEQGTHDELLEKKGLYWEMYQMQQQESTELKQKFV
ncbi:MAG: ATP-binding cassette domain-containing protein [Chitinophagales bacterium]